MAAIIILNILFSFIIYRAVAQQANSSTIGLGSSLNTNGNSYWTSKSGLFAFGFYPKGNSSYAVCVWLVGIQQQTVIWTANRDDPPISGDASLILTADGKLVLQQEQGTQEIATSLLQTAASSASMLDSGNFVLYNSESEIIWQTFKFPTDTIISGQTLLSGNQLVSSISETDHGSGNFRLVMQRDGNLVQYPAKVTPTPQIAYWNTGTYRAGNSTTLNLDGKGWLYLKNDSGIVRNLREAKNASDTTLYRATIDTGGIFRLYSLDYVGTGNWSVQFQTNAYKCAHVCDFNGYCSPGQDGEAECTCPSGFGFIDEKQKNLGCNRNSSAHICRDFTIQVLNDVLFQDNQYSVFNATQDQCREECANDCFCEAAIYQKRKCSKQLLPLRYGRKRTQGVIVTTFIKEYRGGLGTKTSDQEKKKEVLRTAIFVIGITSSALASSLIAIIGILICRFRVWKYRKISFQPNDEILEDVTLRSYSYAELKTATNDFTNQIGKGGFGTVFRGVLSNGHRIVAIKRLEIVVADGEKEFRNEMKAIGRTHHKNLVRLLGYCHEGTNRLLVYEYMSNGSLADFLFKSERKLMWSERIEIAINVARGILYLHEECATQIIHCDIKPENILMDENECAKIADFGLSKLLMPNQSKTYTGMRGTRGYVAPEWHRNMPITVKADVYSFGIMLLEIICCRRNVDMDVAEHEVVLANWVYDCFEAGELNELVVDEEVETSKVDRMVRVGLWCIQDEASLRPSMKKVVLMLEGTIDIPAPPNPPSFSCSI